MICKSIALFALLLFLGTGCTVAPTPPVSIQSDTPVIIIALTPAAAPSATATLRAAASPTATNTPTRIIGAREATATTTPAAQETWKGLMQSTGELPVPNNPCHDAFNTLIELAVESDGTVSGSGQATATVPATCAVQPHQPPVTAVAIKIQGVKQPDHFELRLFPESVTGMLEAGFFANWVGPSGEQPPVQVIPIVRPGRAEGVVEITDTSRFKAGTTHNTYQLDCTNCG